MLGLLCFLMMSACAAPTEELPEEETATAEMPPERTAEAEEPETPAGQERALQDAMADTPGIVFASVTENRVEVGIPDLGLEDATMELIQEYLPPELAERFPELPVAIFQEDFPT